MHDSPVRLTHYDPRWRQEFQQTRSSILHSCDGWVTAVEHVGSTAISGLIARPTIDVVAAVREQDSIAPAADLIEGLNFRCVEKPSWAREGLVLTKPRYLSDAQPDATHQVWLVLESSDLWNRLLRMREWLRANPETAIRFEEAKVASWRNSEGDPSAYQSDKSLFFAHLEDQLEADRQRE